MYSGWCNVVNCVYYEIIRAYKNCRESNTVIIIKTLAHKKVEAVLPLIPLVLLFSYLAEVNTYYATDKQEKLKDKYVLKNYSCVVTKFDKYRQYKHFSKNLH